MKKVLVGIAPAVVAVGLTMPTAHAATSVEFTGVVRYQGHPVPDIEVQIECFKTGFSRRINADEKGVYNTTSTQTECPLDTELKVRAETANNTVGYVGSRQATLQLFNRLDIDTVPKGPIPEFGWISGIVAAGAGVGAIVFARRRYAWQSTGR